MNNYKQFSLINSHQIYSMYLSRSSRTADFFSQFTINSSFDRLESLVIGQLELDILESVLVNLTCLPRLFSLTTEGWNTSENLNHIYRLIFALPMLKYNQLTLFGSNSSISLPIANNKQSSTIENLVINHGCTFQELFNLISYTPQLHRLGFMHTSITHENLRNILPMTLSNLTHLTIDMQYGTFDEFEIFMSKIYSKLKVLSVFSSSNDITYLNANRWETLICNYLPQLEKFYFKYYLRFDDHDNTPEYLGERNQFNSSFWIKRQWILDAKIDFPNIVYSIHPPRYI